MQDETRNERTQREPKANESKVLIAGLGALGVVLAGVLVLVLIGANKPDPIEVAKAWTAAETDRVGEVMAAEILEAVGAQPGLPTVVAKELGGEWIEDRLHEAVQWTYAHEGTVAKAEIVTATASARVQFPTPVGVLDIRAALPVRLSIEGDAVASADVLTQRASIGLEWAPLMEAADLWNKLAEEAGIKN